MRVIEWFEIEKCVFIENPYQCIRVKLGKGTSRIIPNWFKINFHLFNYYHFRWNENLLGLNWNAFDYKLQFAMKNKQNLIQGIENGDFIQWQASL